MVWTVRWNHRWEISLINMAKNIATGEMNTSCSRLMTRVFLMTCQMAGSENSFWKCFKPTQGLPAKPFIGLNCLNAIEMFANGKSLNTKRNNKPGTRHAYSCQFPFQYCERRNRFCSVVRTIGRLLGKREGVNDLASPLPFSHVPLTYSSLPSQRRTSRLLYHHLHPSTRSSHPRRTEAFSR